MPDSWLWMMAWGGVITVWQVILLAQRRVNRQGLILRPTGEEDLLSLIPGEQSLPSVTVVIPASGRKKPKCSGKSA